MFYNCVSLVEQKIFMKMITVRELKSKPGSAWLKTAARDDLVLTNNGKPVAIISPANEKNIEERLRQLSRLRATEAVERIQRRSLELGKDKTPSAVINKVIKKVRKGTGY